MRPNHTSIDPRLEEAEFARRDGSALEVEVLRLETLLRPPFRRQTTAPSRTRFHTLLLVEGGHSAHHVDFERHGVAAGDLLVIPAGRVQAFDRARAIRGYLALFTPGFLDRCTLDVRGLAAAVRPLLGAGAHLQLGLRERSLEQVRRAFTMLADHTASVTDDRYPNEVVVSAFSLLIFILAGLPETAAAVASREPRDALVARFQDLLETRFRVAHGATAYAQALGVSLRTLDRRLLAADGRTTRQFISARLVLEAKRLLTNRDMPIKQVAYELGFSEPQNFTRFLRSQTGLSPRAFRASLQT